MSLRLQRVNTALKARDLCNILSQFQSSAVPVRSTDVDRAHHGRQLGQIRTIPRNPAGHDLAVVNGQVNNASVLTQATKAISVDSSVRIWQMIAVSLTVFCL